MFISLPNPDEIFVKKLNTELYNFLWDSKIDKVKRDIIVKKYIDGGLNMIHLTSFIESLKLTWIRKLYCTSSKWQDILKTNIDVYKLAHCGSDYIDLCKNKSENMFWRDVFKAWLKVTKILNIRMIT